MVSLNRVKVYQKQTLTYVYSYQKMNYERIITVVVELRWFSVCSHRKAETPLRRENPTRYECKKKKINPPYKGLQEVVRSYHGIVTGLRFEVSFVSFWDDIHEFIGKEYEDYVTFFFKEVLKSQRTLLLLSCNTFSSNIIL